MSNPQHGADTLLAPEQTLLSPPPFYKVYLLNDDYTPMDFVVRILQQVFYMNQEQATRIMLKVHNEGRGLCGVFTYEIAETKAARVSDMARLEEHPLQCVLEEN